MDFLPPITIDQQRNLIDKGTPAALNKLVLHTLSEAAAYAKQCARSLNLEEPEVVSLCWMAMRHAAKNYSHRKSRGIRFFAFAKQYIRGQIALELKQKQVVRNGEQAVLSETEETKPLVDTHVDPDFSSMECKELFDKVKPVLFDKLNEIEIAILILRYQSGFSFTEIGERIGCSRQSIQKKHVAAILKLRKELKRKGEIAWMSSL